MSYAGLTVVTGDVATAAWANEIRDSIVNVFASAAARDAAITAPTEGMYADLADTNALTRYSGAAWEYVAHPLLVARLTADDAAMTSDTVLGDVAGMAIPVVASHVYQVWATVVYTAQGGAASGQLKLGWTAPAGATMIWSNIGLVVNGASGVSGSATFDVSAIGDARSYGAAGVGSSCHVLIEGVLTVAGAAGSLQLQAAQAVSSATATTIKAGTIMKLTLIA